MGLYRIQPFEIDFFFFFFAYHYALEIHLNLFYI